MSCDCSGCQRNKQISTLRQLQPDEVSRCRKGFGKYPSKSKKVYMDRYLAARKQLLEAIKRYRHAYERGYANSWMYERLKRDSWWVKKYREARVIVKKLGLV